MLAAMGWIAYPEPLAMASMGGLSLNAAAMRLIGRPRSVEVLLGEEGRSAEVRPCEEREVLRGDVDPSCFHYVHENGVKVGCVNSKGIGDMLDRETPVDVRGGNCRVYRCVPGKGRSLVVRFVE